MYRKPLESSIEKSFADFATAKELLYLKFSVAGQAGYPDRLILGPRRTVLFLEWKREGATNKNRKGEKLQAYRHMMLRSWGFEVHIVSSITEAKHIVRCAVRNNAAHNGYIKSNNDVGC